jgi:hypothetical protein
MSNRHKAYGKSKAIKGLFVPLLKDTLEADAWRAMEPSSRLIYIALKARYGFELRNNGRIYLSVRMAAKEVGVSINTAARGFHELQHYGFIVMTEPGSLGVDGKGKAPHWRLTELGYMTDPPTKDFMRRDHTKFRYQKKQNPVSTTATPRLNEYDIQPSQPLRQSPDELSQPLRHTADRACINEYDISRVTTPPASSAGDEQASTHAALPADDWRRNSKSPAERLEIPADGSIPPFLRRSLN